MPVQTAYIGRFAPSPTGPLHLGSLCTAVASYLDARAHRGQWLLRLEDLDPPREQAGAAEAIIQSLRAHGLQWDGDILWQSRRSAAYDLALQSLLDRGLAFYCSCSRRQLAGHGGIHRGACIARLNRRDAAIRLRTDSTAVQFNDRLLGRQNQPLSDTGDVVIKRRDGLYAYQLAVVVDDTYQQISHVVRGIDLLNSTAVQIRLHELLGHKPPRFLHLPVLVSERGEKLSKQHGAPALNDRRAALNLRQVLGYLGQATPPAGLTCPAMLEWAVSHWDMSRLPQTASVVVQGL